MGFALFVLFALQETRAIIHEQISKFNELKTHLLSQIEGNENSLKTMISSIENA